MDHDIIPEEESHLSRDLFTDTQLEDTLGQNSGTHNENFSHWGSGMQNPFPFITLVPEHLVRQPLPQPSHPENTTFRRPTRMELDGDDSLDAFISFYEIVETKLSLSRMNVRDFAQLQRTMEANPGFNHLPVGSKNTKHKLKFQFEERRTRSQIVVWKQLRDEATGEKTVNFGDYFPQCDELSEEFRDWFYTYLIDILLDENQNNAGSILELAQPGREIFLKELKRLHTNNKDCVNIFSPLYTPADVEASIIWGCRCSTCASVLPQVSNYQKDHDFQTVPKIILEKFRTDFMKLKAKQWKDVLIAHRNRVDLMELTLFPHFSGWGRPQFVRALKIAHRKTNCRICSHEGMHENTEFESGILQQIETPFF